MMFLTHLLRLPTLLAFLALPGSALAQAHEREIGPYVLRATVSTTAAIAPESAQKYDIDRQADRAILNVIVIRRDDPQMRPLPARVNATMTNLAGIKKDIELQAIEANDRVSYTGTFEYAPREVADFAVSALPEGSDQTLSMEFRERLWRGR